MSILSLIIVLILTTFVLVTATSTFSKFEKHPKRNENPLSCQYNQIKRKCAPSCEITCANRYEICPTVCSKHQVCVCPAGHVFYSSTIKVCFPSQYCRSTNTRGCIHGKKATNCARRCTQTCADPHPNCAPGCDRSKRCQCPVGMVQKSLEDETCVKITDCVEQSCTHGQVYTTCASMCPKTCDNPFPRCTRNCDFKNHCHCPRGEVQQSLTNKTCVRLNFCRTNIGTIRTPPSRKGCTGDMIPTACASMCPLTCDQPHPRPCVRMCNWRKNCRCPSGLLEHNGRCIQYSDCPHI